MLMNEYQSKAAETAHFPEYMALPYLTMGLCGEAGEVANLIKKVYRDADGDIEAVRADVVDELGDVLWYVAMIADYLDCGLDLIAEQNLRKLRARGGGHREFNPPCETEN
jgi:NTP pyrophosphatase (non-canonical NTP hydrolase)